MISRGDMRMLMQAARNGWDTPNERQYKAFADCREVLNSAEATERECETALAAVNTFEEAGWIEKPLEVLQ
jgi:hypothetical protein